jgi:hypothetical protein
MAGGTGAVRQETLRVVDADRRLQQLGAQFMNQGDDGRLLYYLPSYGLYAVVRKTFGGAWIGYYKDRKACGCG